MRERERKERESKKIMEKKEIALALILYNATGHRMRLPTHAHTHTAQWTRKPISQYPLPLFLSFFLSLTTSINRSYMASFSVKRSIAQLYTNTTHSTLSVSLALKCPCCITAGS